MSALTRLAAFVSGLAALAGWALAAVDVQVVRSPGGIEAWLVEERGLPIISIQAGFDGGSRLDPKEKAGLAYLAASLLNEGAGDMDSTAFMGALEDKAIYFGGSSDEDSFYVSLTTLTANKDEAFRLAELALTKPRLDPEAIDRMKAQIAAYQRRLDENPTRSPASPGASRRSATILTPAARSARPRRSPPSRARTSSGSWPRASAATSSAS